MVLSINEAQIVCAILMGLITLKATVFLPRKVVADTVFGHARIFVVFSTSLLTLHFLLQYILHKPFTISYEQRAFINLIFCIPASLGINLSLIYLQCKGKIKRWMWQVPTAAYLMSILYFSLVKIGFSNHLYDITPQVRYSLYFMSICYAFTLLFCSVIQCFEFFRIKNYLKNHHNESLELLNQWSPWFIVLMGLGGLALPIMFFSENIMLRSVYLLFIICIVFFYIFSFLGYGVRSYAANYLNEALHNSHVTSSAESKQNIPPKLTINESDFFLLKQNEVAVINEKIAMWTAQKKFLQTGLTVKDVAEDIGIHRNSLNAWLKSKGYKQFGNWLNELRIEEAKELILKHPDWSNETVAKSCGIAGRSYFQRLFRDITGVTPSKWLEKTSDCGHQKNK